MVSNLSLLQYNLSKPDTIGVRKFFPSYEDEFKDKDLLRVFLEI